MIEIGALPQTPEFYPQKLDLARDRALLLHMRQDDYRSASFLDDRILLPHSRAAWVPLEALTPLAAKAAPCPLHFIFHIGHCGSTLLSRLLDGVPNILPLREPLPLRDLAELFDHDPGPKAQALLETFLNLWSRGYPETDAVILKATSNTARLAPHLLTTRPKSKAITLYLRAEPAIATLLAGENSAQDLNALGPERHHRLKTLLNTPEFDQPRNLGTLAAMSWLTERLTQQAIAQQFGAQILPIDFDTLLAEPASQIKAALDHFGLKDDPERLAQSPAFTRYAKALEQAYSPQLRARMLEQSRKLYGAEMSEALNWIDTLCARFNIALP